MCVSRSTNSTPITSDSEGTPSAGVPKETWMNLVRARLREWGPLSQDVVIARLTPLMPPGYAWHRYVVDSKLRQRLEAKGLWEEGDPVPEPQSQDDYLKAQQALAKWFIRQLRRNGELKESRGKITWKEKGHARSQRR